MISQAAGSGCRTTPWIQMKGRWLRQVGFDVDTPIKIRAMDGCLVLTVD
ncbi:SymE family type I addiction module toxin [Microbulbifer sp. MLAF003]